MEWNGMEWNGMEWNGMEWNGIESHGIKRLKTNRSADHSADTGTAARPAATDLALDIDAAVFIAESHASCATVALVIGVE